jgi:hypothetical protein
MFGMEKTVWASNWTLEWQQHNINTQGVEWDLPLMFSLENELKHFYKNQSFKIRNINLVMGCVGHVK